jgi:Xaa-Pro aminopeptidase
MIGITPYINAIKQLSTRSHLDGWIFSNFSHHDRLTDTLLQIDDTISTRRWIYILFADREPLKILHTIEPHALDTVPGISKNYYALDKMQEYLQEFQGKTFAVLSDPYNAEISTMDGGFIEILHNCGIHTVTAAPLIQQSKGIITKSGIQSQERAATLLYTIVERTWQVVCEAYTNKIPLYEKTLEQFIMQCFTEYNLVTDHPPIVAFGANTGNPHFEVPKTNSAKAKEGDLIQFDIWAKEAIAADDNGNIGCENAIYADISWVGVYSNVASETQIKDFTNLIKARDIVYQTLSKAANSNSIFSITGASLDNLVRKNLIKSGYEQRLRHRTGHAIDTDCHGSGVNLDSIEFPDNRTVLEGSCFSVEPGIYTNSGGMRTEINLYIQNGKPVISGQKFTKKNSLSIPQKMLLTTI